MKADIGDYIRANAYDPHSPSGALPLLIVDKNEEDQSYGLENGGVIGDADIQVDDVLLESEVR